jgi:hypothetical protein
MAALISVAIRVLDTMFIVGMIGSAVVVLISAVEDLETLFGSEESGQ